MVAVSDKASERRHRSNSTETVCNLYSNTMPPEAMLRLFGVRQGHNHLGNQPSLSSISPRYDAPVVRLTPQEERELISLHWGFLLPQTSKKTGKPVQPKAVTNARDDKVLTSPFWRDSFRHRRCLVPATSFSEPRGKAPARYYWFGLNGDEERPPFTFAGLWRTFKGLYRNERVELDTFTIVTTRPNAVVEPIHPTRMPVIVSPDDHELWLTGGPEQAGELLRPFPSGQMRVLAFGEGMTADPGARGHSR